MTAEFTNTIIYYLNQKNISYEYFSIMLNIHPKQVIRMLKGDYNFKLNQIVRIEVVLSVKLLEIIK